MRLIELLIYIIAIGAGGMTFSLVLVYTRRKKNNPNMVTKFLGIITYILIGILLLLILENFSDLGTNSMKNYRGNALFKLVTDLIVYAGMACIVIFLPGFTNFLIANPNSKIVWVFNCTVAGVYLVIGIFNSIMTFNTQANHFGLIQSILFSAVYFYAVIIIWIHLKDIDTLYIRKICLGFNIVSLSMIPLLICSIIFPEIKTLSYALFILAFFIVLIIYFYSFFSQEGFKEDKKDKLTFKNLIKYNISKREFEVVNLIDEGLTNKEIGDKLGISVNTVNNHVAKVFSKIGVRSRIDMLNTIRNK